MIVAFGSEQQTAIPIPEDVYAFAPASAASPHGSAPGGVTTRQPGSLEAWLPSLLVAAAIGACVYVVARRKGYVANADSE